MSINLMDFFGGDKDPKSLTQSIPYERYFFRDIAFGQWFRFQYKFHRLYFIDIDAIFFQKGIKKCFAEIKSNDPRLIDKQDRFSNNFPTKTQMISLFDLSQQFNVPAFNIQVYDHYSWTPKHEYDKKMEKLKKYATKLGLFRAAQNPRFKVHRVIDPFHLEFQKIYNESEFITFLQTL